ncbi:MAG: hypothetical protein AAFY59_01960 [Pseudomonadota bacterium]
MGYRDDFYTVKNIIGHTGKIESNPTVYFLHKVADTEIYYGHITQSHADGANVGREPVRQTTFYDAGNITVDGKLIYEETVDGFNHQSRSAFTDIRDLSEKQIAVLARAIHNVQEEKTYRPPEIPAVNKNDPSTWDPKASIPLTIKELIEKFGG